MRAALAFATLRRHRTRTALAMAGVAVAAALLLNMVMLGIGMRESFRDLLEVVGFDLRAAPKGTLPFDTEATIDSATTLLSRFASDPDIAAVSPVLGASLRLETTGGAAATAFAIGIDRRVQGDYRLEDGADATAPEELVASADLLAALGARVGDSVTVSAGSDSQLRVASAERRMRIAGRARFIYAARRQRIHAMPLATLQTLTAQPDRISLVMLRARAGADPEAVRGRLEHENPRVTLISTASAIRQVDERLRYFRQIAAVLGSVSLLVGFLLVTTLVTVSVNERLGEIAVLRAIGVSRVHVVQQVLIETAVLSLGGTLLGLGLGLATARWLNGILIAMPGLPAGIEFFRFQADAAWRALGLLALAAIAAAAYPSWRASSLPIAATLRREAIA